MGFLSKFSGSERIDLGDNYWVEVRRFLTSEQQDAAELALIQPRMTIVPDGKGKVRQEMVAAMDIASYNREIAAQAILSWNLTDERDAILPCGTLEEIRASLRRLPASVIRTVAEKIGKAEAGDQTPEQFPGGGEESAPDGD